MAHQVLVIGDVMTDIIVVPEGPLVHGSDRRAVIQQIPGGSGANQAVWLGHFGVEVALAARVAAADAPQLAADFRGSGVVPHLTADPGLRSGVVVTLIDLGGERSFLTDRGANLHLVPEDVPEALYDGITYLVVSGYTFLAEGPRDVALSALARARARGIKVVIDPASVGFLREAGGAEFLRWTGNSSLLLANADEARELCRLDDIEVQMRMLGQSYDEVIIKLGARGAVLGGATGVRLRVDAPEVAVVDTTGAGDAFAGGFLAARLRGESDEACLQSAVAAGSAATTFLGARPQR